MGFFYPSISDAFEIGTTGVTSILIHLLVLLLSTGISLYGLWGVVKYSRDVSKNAHLLHIAFALIAFIPIGDLFEHFDYAPGMDFWHHMHLFAGIAAFYFLHKFAVTADAGQVEPKNSIIVLIAMLILGTGVYLVEESFEKTYPVLVITSYIFLITVMSYFTYFLLEIVQKAKKTEAAFSLKSFSMAMIPIIAACLFVLTFTAIVAEFALDVFPLKSHSNPFILFLVALQNPLYLMLAMTLAGFAYMGEKIRIFYLHKGLPRKQGKEPEK